MVVAVVSTADPHVKVPEWEQVMSAGAACQNILLTAHALGYGAQWLSEWYGYNKRMHAVLGMEPHNRVALFIDIVSYKDKPEERARPDLQERIKYWGVNS